LSEQYIHKLIKMLEDEVNKIEHLLSQNVSSEFKESLSETLKKRKDVIDKFKGKLF